MDRNTQLQPSLSLSILLRTTDTTDSPLLPTLNRYLTITKNNMKTTRTIRTSSTVVVSLITLLLITPKNSGWKWPTRLTRSGMKLYWSMKAILGKLCRMMKNNRFINVKYNSGLMYCKYLRLREKLFLSFLMVLRKARLLNCIRNIGTIWFCFTNRVLESM